MTLKEFKKTIPEGPEPDASLSPALRALWWEARGNWDKAHELCQQGDGRSGAWVHAYLHRKEGDEGNASYWYSRARRSKPSGTLEEEWDGIAGELLSSLSEEK